MTKAGLQEYENAVEDLWEELDRLAEAEKEIAQIQLDLEELILETPVLITVASQIALKFLTELHQKTYTVSLVGRPLA